jgi:hypothetical protein
MIGLLAVLWTLLGPSKPYVVKLKISPQVCFSPCKVNLQGLVPEKEDNRLLLFVVTGDGEYQESQVPLEGMNGPFLTTRTLTVATAGEYNVVAVVYNSTREVGRAITTLIVRSQ